MINNCIYPRQRNGIDSASGGGGGGAPLSS